MPNPHTAEAQDHYVQANAAAEVTVGPGALPLMCPNRQSALWASHPRVFLPIETAPQGTLLCPYCGTRYTLVR
jgi:uncharacterized Zn-finger protein